MTCMTKKTLLLSAGGALASLIAPAALALQTDTITVTAQRRAQNIQDVPIAVTALSEEQLQNRQVEETLDVIRYVPNAIAQNNTGLGTANTYYFRGLGSTESIATFEVPVGTYIDDVYLSRQIANNVALLDVERVEVLRGPQGMLFGRNTTGGAVNVILKKPGEDFAVSAEIGYGRFSRFVSKASVDIPLSENFLTKLTGYYIDDDGFTSSTTTGEDELNDQQAFGVRGAARILPTENATWDIALTYAEDDHANIANFKDPATGDRLSRTGFSQTGGALAATGMSGRKANFGQGNKVDQLSIISNLAFDLEAFDIELITAYLDTSQQFAIDFPVTFAAPTGPAGAFVIAQDSEHKQFTQEIKLVGSFFNDSIDYVAGAYFLREDNLNEYGDVFGILLADRLVENDTTSWALYSQFDWSVTDRLTLTAGVRYTDEKKELTLTDLDPANNATDFSNANLEALGILTELNEGVFTPRFVASYDLSDDVSIFASATRGFKSGAWSARATSVGAFIDVEPEFLWSYEAGFRSAFFDNRLIFNTTFFYLDLKDYQIPANTAAGFVTDNFGDLENKGIEIDFSARPVDNLTLYGSLGWQDAEFSPPSQTLLDNSALPPGVTPEPVRSPDLTWVLGGNYEIPVNQSGGAIVANASVQYIGDQNVQVANGAAGFADDALYTNASIGYRAADNRWSLMAECDNCFGTARPVAVVFVPYINEPARWTVRWRMTY